MSEPFLIAHKVRGLPAFDIAIQVPCALCQVPADPIYDKMLNPPGPHRVDDCDSCDSQGYWWMVPTSGHRAYPYWSNELKPEFMAMLWEVPDLPPDLPDHYPIRPEPTVAKRSLLEELGLARPGGTLEKIKRRI